ncbi:MAG: PAS domain-containing sensor histidine kinase [Campylobacterota bacterium]|nr:PAS domain-containing sensor histidine kinase [Campylobacterota bacterium]
MKKLTIKQISLYGFLTIIAAVIFSAFFIYIFLSKYENLNLKHSIYDQSYTTMLEYKYFTERLLTTYDLPKEKKLWQDSKKKFKESMDLLKTKDKQINDFYNVIDNKSNKILIMLENKLFKEQSVMEKSILRRLGEGLNSNEKSNYYIAISDLKNAIDYLKQYEEFLLDELKELRNNQEEIMISSINDLKYQGSLIPFLTIIFGIIFIFFIQRLIGSVETDLIITKENLQDTLDESNYILNASMESIMIAKNDVCIDVNNATLETFGYSSKNELVGKPTTVFIAPESTELAKSKQKLDVVAPYEANCITKDQRVMPSLIQAYNYKNKKDETIRVSAIIDLTQVKEQEELLFQQSKMATMGEMLENIAHQWRQPLSVISTSATGIKVQKEYGISNEKEEIEALDTINKSVQHLSNTIDDFRSFFKADKEKEQFKICDAFKKTEELMSSKLKNRNINIVKDEQDITLLGYENELIQAFMNIINNAKDALEESEQDNKTIFFTLKENQNNAIITIKDNAGGIPQDVLPNIFNEHFTTKGDKDGTGIGLYMTKMIIDKITGTIQAANETYEYNGKTYTGAVFTIKIPLN